MEHYALKYRRLSNRKLEEDRIFVGIFKRRRIFVIVLWGKTSDFSSFLCNLLAVIDSDRHMRAYWKA